MSETKPETLYTVGYKLIVSFSHLSIHTYSQYSEKEKTVEITEPLPSELKKGGVWKKVEKAWKIFLGSQAS